MHAVPSEGDAVHTVCHMQLCFQHTPVPLLTSALEQVAGRCWTVRAYKIELKFFHVIYEAVPELTSEPSLISVSVTSCHMSFSDYPKRSLLPKHIQCLDLFGSLYPECSSGAP